MAKVNSSAHTHDLDESLLGRLKLSIVLTSLIFVAELVGGYMTNSLALMSDAAHVFMDVLALTLSLFAIYISRLPANEKRTFGLHRVEVFVAFINSFSILFITLYIFYKAYLRFLNPEPVESLGMLAVAVVGLVVNLLVARWLMRYAKSDLNVKSAFLHVVGDAMASVGVIIASIVIYYTGWYVVDPIISVMIGCIIMYGSIRIISESSHILLEGVPRDIDFSDVMKDITGTEGITNVHSLHIWSICHNVYALSAHVDIEPASRHRMGRIFNDINERLAQTYHIFYTTLQAECIGCNPEDTFGSLTHSDKDHIH